MTKKKEPYKIPEEFKFAPKSVKESWQKGRELDEKINDTAFNTIVLADKYGEPLYINCNAVYSQNKIRMKRAGVDNPADYELVENRSKELKNIQREKGHCTRACNGYMTGNSHSNITDWKKQDILEQFGE